MYKRNFIVPSIAFASLIPFFEGEKKTGWKLTEDGKGVELRDGNPVWIGEDGTESTLGGDTITRLNREAKGHRERAEAAETKLEAVKDIDPAAARDALEKLSKIDQKKLIDAGEVDRVKADIAGQYEGKLTEAQQALADANKRADDLVLTQAFTGSKFIADKIAVPVDMVRATFGQNFKVEDGKVVAYGADGNKLLSKAKQGEYADFDEALGLIVNGYSAKDAILKGNNHSGTGNNGGGGGGKPGQARYSRDEFAKLPPAEQSRISQESLAGKAEIYDA